MTKSMQYLYLGENGSILSPVKLPDVYCIKQVRLTSESNCQLTKDGINFCNSILVPLSESDEWYEVVMDGQKTSIE